MGIGAITFCRISLGWLAIGGIAVGYATLGGLAYGKYAAGGKAVGEHTITEQYEDPAAIEFFSRVMPEFLQF